MRFYFILEWSRKMDRRVAEVFSDLSDTRRAIVSTIDALTVRGERLEILENKSKELAAGSRELVARFSISRRRRILFIIASLLLLFLATLWWLKK